MKLNEKDLERFFSKVDKQPDGCWLWTGNTNDRGYGQFFIQGKGYADTGSFLTHRLSFMIANPEIILETKDVLCHKCDNPPCCNPDHLFVGTYMDNVRDSIEKGRHTGAKLTEAKVRELYKDYDDGFRPKDLASKYGIHLTSIRNVLSGRVWPELYEKWIQNGGGRRVKEDKGPRKQMLILIPEVDFWQLKQIAAQERMTQQDLVLTALKEKYGVGIHTEEGEEVVGSRS